MLKICGSIKRKCVTFAVLPAVLFAGFLSAGAHGQPPAPAQPATTQRSGLSFLASARLKSPDRSFEAATGEFRVNLDGSQSVVLKGRSLSVTLDSEPSGFSNAQLVRVSASGNAGQRGDAASFTAGTFKVSDNGEHSFLFVEKNKGWLLEVRLRPIEVAKPVNPQPAPSKNQSPARYLNPRKPKRLPA